MLMNAKLINVQLHHPPGDISYQLYIKERQQCKPFKYFIEHVAPDMLDRFPFREPPEFASGAIQTMADPKFCIDAMSRPKDSPLGKFFASICAIATIRLLALSICRLVPVRLESETATRQPAFHIAIPSGHRFPRQSALLRQLRPAGASRPEDRRLPPWTGQSILPLRPGHAADIPRLET
jgi:hypothetical protein